MNLNKVKYIISRIVFKARIFFKDLDALAIRYGTDKVGHGYIQHYKAHFRSLRNKRLNILEIGILKGASLRMWKHYFTKSMIYGIDIQESSMFQEERIMTFKGHQASEGFLSKVANKISPLDIVIDDGGHINEDVIKTFKLLFPLLQSGGIYVIEDLHTSYCADYGGDEKNPNNPGTVMAFLKSLTDCLNHAKYKRRFNPGYKLKNFDEKIKAIHFYKTLTLIYKT